MEKLIGWLEENRSNVVSVPAAVTWKEANGQSIVVKLNSYGMLKVIVNGKAVYIGNSQADLISQIERGKLITQQL